VGEGDAYPLVPTGSPGGVGGFVVSLLSPSLSAAPDGGCAINREANGRAASPGAVAFSALLVGAVVPQLGEIPPVGFWRGCWVQVGTRHLLLEHHQQLSSAWSRAEPEIGGDRGWLRAVGDSGNPRDSHQSQLPGNVAFRVGSGVKPGRCFTHSRLLFCRDRGAG